MNEFTIDDFNKVIKQLISEGKIDKDDFFDFNEHMLPEFDHFMIECIKNQSDE